LGFSYITPLIPASNYRGLLIYGGQLICLILSTVLALLFVTAVFYKNKIPMKEAAPPLKETTSLFSFNKFGNQIIFSLLLLFLVYIPLDFVTYAFPGGLDFSQRSLADSDINAYLSFTQFGPFILYGLVLHFMVGIREELFFRGFFTMRAEKYVIIGSTVVITSMYFGLSHLGYLFFSANPFQDLLPAILWTLGAFYVGSVSAVFILKRRLIWPVILAHFLNNVISSTVLWLNSVQNVTFFDLTKWLYIPLLTISIILAVIFFQEVKSGVKSYFGVFKSYKTEIPEKRTRSKIILADIVFGLLFWAVGMWFI
jgi:membrane protease YdiL (CAAX protease family)